MSHSLQLVLLHGWGMNSGIWTQLLDQFSSDIMVKCIDLNGTDSSAVSSGNLDELVENISHEIKRPSVLLGWSMGGLVSLRLAQCRPENVIGVFQVSSSPCFVRREGWECAIEESIFNDFAKSLENDVEKTISRFLTLQVAGSVDAKQTLMILREGISEIGLPKIESLRRGLHILSTTDLRQQLSQIDVPVHWLFGSRDKIVPVETADAIVELSPVDETTIIEGAAHAPFVSHRKLFLDELYRFVEWTD